MASDALVAAARQAIEAMRRTYEVTDWPADGKSPCDEAIAALEAALASAPPATGGPTFTETVRATGEKNAELFTRLAGGASAPPATGGTSEGPAPAGMAAKLAEQLAGLQKYTIIGRYGGGTDTVAQSSGGWVMWCDVAALAARLREGSESNG